MESEQPDWWIQHKKKQTLTIQTFNSVKSIPNLEFRTENFENFQLDFNTRKNKRTFVLTTQTFNSMKLTSNSGF